MKRTLAYVNPDCYVDVDMTVLKHLSRAYEVIWYAVYYTDRPIYYDAEQMSDYAAQYGIRIRLCPRRYRQRDPRNLRFYKEIVRDINAQKADLVYSCIAEELYWTLASRELDAPRVLGLHDVRMHHFGNPLKRLIQSGIRELTIKQSKYVCVFSKNQRELFTRIYRRDACQLALCSRTLGPSQREIPAFSEGIRLLFFGNIVEYKGLDLLISCLEKLRAEGVDNLSLTIAGAGEFWETCEPLMRTRQMYNPIIRFIDNDEIPDLMATHHFLALPYRDATQSGPLTLALGYGVPVLAPAYGCFLDYCNVRSAVLYESLEEGLRRLASMCNDEYAVMRTQAARQGEAFSEESVARKYIDFFNGI